MMYNSNVRQGRNCITMQLVNFSKTKGENNFFSFWTAALWWFVAITPVKEKKRVRSSGRIWSSDLEFWSMIEFRIKPFGSWAVNNATSGHSDSWHKPCQVPLPSQMKLAMCALQMKPLLDLSHTAMHHSGALKNTPDINCKIFPTPYLLCLIIHSVILGAVGTFPVQLVTNSHASLRGGIMIDFRSCLDADSLDSQCLWPNPTHRERKYLFTVRCWLGHSWAAMKRLTFEEQNREDNSQSQSRACKITGRREECIFKYQIF